MVDNLVRDIDKRDWHWSTGFLGTPFLLFTLADHVKQQATVLQVKIRNVVHKGLKRLYAEDTALDEILQPADVPRPTIG